MTKDTDIDPECPYCSLIEGVVQSEQDALDLVALCGEKGTDKLLLHSSNLPDDFFDLKTGLAGSILLKFSNYHLKVAAVIPQARIGKGRFFEFASESRKSRDFRIFTDENQAVTWLTSE